MEDLKEENHHGELYIVVSNENFDQEIVKGEMNESEKMHFENQLYNTSDNLNEYNGENQHESTVVKKNDLTSDMLKSFLPNLTLLPNDCKISPDGSESLGVDSTLQTIIFEKDLKGTESNFKTYQIHNQNKMACSKINILTGEKGVRQLAKRNDMCKHCVEDLDKPNKCRECGPTISCCSTLENHTEQQGEGPYQCGICQKCFEEECNLTKHIEQHALNPANNGRRNMVSSPRKSILHKCEFCHKNFVKKRDLEKHSESRLVDKKLKCNDCNTSFCSNHQFQKHMRMHAPSDAKPSKCDKCGKVFTSSTSLQMHLKVHDGERPFTCHICGKNFKRLPHLRGHLKIHCGEEPHKCQVCGKGFKDHSYLLKHERIHTGDKPYTCMECGKGFVQSQTLSRHLLVHTGVKPYTCEYCEKSYSQKPHLKRHILTHTGERPHMCSVCTKTFTRSNHLEAHMRIHTGDKPFSCDLCGKKFNQNQHLNTHIKTHR